jgi:hypothetical protein
MTPTERADLNRRAAELAGWQFDLRETGTRPSGKPLVVLWITEPGEPPYDRASADPEWWTENLNSYAPDFCGSPALWWPLVERFAGLLGEYYPRQWHGPTYRADRGGIWEVGVTLPNGWHQRYEASTPGEAACRAALAVAEALGLG